MEGLPSFTGSLGQVICIWVVHKCKAARHWQELTIFRFFVYCRGQLINLLSRLIGIDRTFYKLFLSAELGLSMSPFCIEDTLSQSSQTTFYLSVPLKLK